MNPSSHFLLHFTITLATIVIGFIFLDTWGVIGYLSKIVISNRFYCFHKYKKFYGNFSSPFGMFAYKEDFCENCLKRKNFMIMGRHLDH